MRYPFERPPRLPTHTYSVRTEVALERKSRCSRPNWQSSGARRFIRRLGTPLRAPSRPCTRSPPCCRIGCRGEASNPSSARHFDFPRGQSRAPRLCGLSRALEGQVRCAGRTLELSPGNAPTCSTPASFRSRVDKACNGAFQAVALNSSRATLISIQCQDGPEQSYSTRRGSGATPKARRLAAEHAFSLEGTHESRCAPCAECRRGGQR